MPSPQSCSQLQLSAFERCRLTSGVTVRRILSSSTLSPEIRNEHRLSIEEVDEEDEAAIYHSPIAHPVQNNPTSLTEITGDH